MYSQNFEDQIVWDYLKKKGIEQGTVLDIGANDGTTFSNSLYFIESGWSAYLFEPSRQAFDKLRKLHENNPNVKLFNSGVSAVSEIKILYDCGSLINENDLSLVATTQKNDKEKWQHRVNYFETEAFFIKWQDFLNGAQLENQTFDFITIDAEGEDWEILKQINLLTHDCSVLCVEWNGLPTNEKLFTEYANSYNLYEISRNGENIIFAK